MAADTGGEYFHDNNDFLAGFRKTSALPDIYYLLPSPRRI